MLPHPSQPAGLAHVREGGTRAHAGRCGGFRRLPEKERGLEEPVGKKRGAGVKAPKEMSCSNLEHEPSRTGVPPSLHTNQGTDGGIQPKWSCSAAA